MVWGTTTGCKQWRLKTVFHGMVFKMTHTSSDIVRLHQYCLKELQNCIWKIQNKQKATVKLKVVLPRASRSGDAVFSSWAFWLAVRHTTGRLTPGNNRGNAYVTLWHRRLHTSSLYTHAATCFKSFFNMCMHILMSWEGLSSAGADVWPSQRHSTSLMPAGPACSPPPGWFNDFLGSEISTAGLVGGAHSSAHELSILVCPSWGHDKR